MMFTPTWIITLIVLPVPDLDPQTAWCGVDSGEIMYIDGSDQIGFNEHTLCTADSVVDLTDSASWAGALSCKNVYIEGPDSAGNYSSHETELPDVSISIFVVNPDQLVVTPLGRAAETYDRCG